MKSHEKNFHGFQGWAALVNRSGHVSYIIEIVLRTILRIPNLDKYIRFLQAGGQKLPSLHNCGMKLFLVFVRKTS